MPPGPSSALPASPAQSPPFPGAGSAEPAAVDGEPACHREDGVSPGAGKNSEPVSDVKRSVKKKQQKNMLARASPAALHLKMQAREQQQLNGSVSPTEEADSRPHPGSLGRPDDPTPSVDNCDSGSSDTNNSEHCQHEGHGPCSKNGSHSPLVNNSVNGMPAYTRTEAARGQLAGDGGKEEFDHTEPPRPPSDEPPDAAGPGGKDGPAAEEQQQQPPAAELARLDLNSSAGRAQEEESHGIRYVRYESELQMPWIMRLITKDLSEPYSIYTYRYFIHNWPQLCFLVSTTLTHSVFTVTVHHVVWCTVGYSLLLCHCNVVT